MTRSFVLYVSFIHMRVGNVMSSLLSHSPSRALSLFLPLCLAFSFLLSRSASPPSPSQIHTRTRTIKHSLSLFFFLSRARSLSLHFSPSLFHSRSLTPSLSFYLFAPPPFPSCSFYLSHSPPTPPPFLFSTRNLCLSVYNHTNLAR